MKKAAKHEANPTTRVTAPKTVALAARTLRRWGTAAKVDRIMPVLNSLVMINTPSTAIASWARKRPFRLNCVGLKSSRSAGLNRSKRLT